MDRAGLVGDDGPTHHGAFDIAYLRRLPNIVLMAPRDEAMLVHMLHTALTYDDGPVALRYPRGEAVGVALPDAPRAIAIGTGEILRAGAAARSRSLGYGTGVGKALEAADLLREHGIEVTVADARFAKPLDAGLVAQLMAEHELLVTVEEGVLAGGFGSAVWETLSDAGAAVADPARRPARPLRHARRAGAAARGGRVHGREDRGPDPAAPRRASRRPRSLACLSRPRSLRPHHSHARGEGTGSACRIVVAAPTGTSRPPARSRGRARPPPSARRRRACGRRRAPAS